MGGRIIMASIDKGKLVDTKVKQKIFSTLHRGKLPTINAIVVHQTGAETAAHTFNSYKGSSAHGAHFLIDKNGDIYQTALITQKTTHVGKLRSRCLVTKICSKDELAAANAIYLKKGQSYPVRVKKLNDHEKIKDYPDRYPQNDDSIGVEIVGGYDDEKDEYEAVNSSQNESLKWLVNAISENLDLDTSDDVYRHPEVSYKKPSEAKTAEWNK
jgi:N-acetyl-anhydromuramyl-L-alanine amidase AmpD